MAYLPSSLKVRLPSFNVTRCWPIITRSPLTVTLGGDTSEPVEIVMDLERLAAEQPNLAWYRPGRRDLWRVGGVLPLDANDPGNSNSAPVIDLIADIEVTVGQTIKIPLSAFDLDGDNVTIEVSGPGFVTDFKDNGDGTAEITFAPGDTDVGE